MKTNPSVTHTPRSVSASWKIIEAVLAKDAPQLLRALRAPATPKAIEVLVRRIGKRLPADLRQSLASTMGCAGPTSGATGSSTTRPCWERRRSPPSHG